MLLSLSLTESKPQTAKPLPQPVKQVEVGCKKKDLLLSAHAPLHSLLDMQ